MSENEVWKDIKGYEGLYQVSNLGRVKHLKKNKIKEIYHSKHGYCRVGLSKNGKMKNKLVHRLVAEQFIDNEMDKPQVNHIDGDKSNNRVENLEWVTASENQIHSYSKGLNKGSEKQKEAVRINGLKNSIKVLQLNKENKILKEWKSLSEIERVLKIPAGNISHCCKGRRKTAGGFMWRYKNEL